MKRKYINTYMEVAEAFAKQSTVLRLKVGAVIVTKDGIMLPGYNGTPSGWDNVCEFKECSISGMYFDEEVKTSYNLKTKPEVLHAESNSIAKLARSTQSGEGAEIFVTHAPCIDCSKMIFQSGINSVYYRNSYRNESGINFLLKTGVSVEKI